MPLKHRLLGAPFLVLAMLAIFGLAVAACGNDDDDPVDDTPVDDVADDTDDAVDDAVDDTDDAIDDAVDDAVDDTDDAVVDDETERTLNLAYVPGWDEGVAVTFLWQHLLEEEGYDIELHSPDVAPLYQGIADGDYDVYLDGWFPATHEVYQDEFGDDLVLHHMWYEGAGLYLTVPEYVDAESLADLADMADVFDSEIMGIEPGAGMMGIAADSVMPAYGLDDWELIEASTPAMLAELDSAIADEEPIIVTLWEPGWWYARYDLRNLEDPENAWGDPEELWVVVNTEFADNYPTLAGWLENFQMDDPEIAPLLDLIEEYGDGNESDAIEEWLEDDENRELAEGWIN